MFNVLDPNQIIARVFHSMFMIEKREQRFWDIYFIIIMYMWNKNVEYNNNKSYISNYSSSATKMLTLTVQ